MAVSSSATSLAPTLTVLPFASLVGVAVFEQGRAQAHVDDVRVDVRGVDNPCDHTGKRTAPGLFRQHLDRHDLRVGSDADDARLVVDRSDGAGDVRSVVEVGAGGDVTALARNE